MSSPLTYGAVRAALSEIIFGDQDDARFLSVCNDAVSRIYDAGKWEGLVGIVEFENPIAGFITLPRRYSAILGVQLAGHPRSTFTRYFEFSQSGPGDVNIELGLKFVVDQGPTPTYEVFTGPSPLTIVAPSDPTIGLRSEMRIFGLDENGKEIYDTSGAPGVRMSHNIPSVASFSEITAVIKPPTIGYVTLKAGSTTLSVYEPGETNPSYRRYKVGTENDRVFRCLCKRRFVPIAHDSDLIHPGNLGALKMALLAASAENASLTAKAQEYWALCYSLLDLEKGAARGNAEIRFNFKPGGQGARPIRNFR